VLLLLLVAAPVGSRRRKAAFDAQEQREREEAAEKVALARERSSWRTSTGRDYRRAGRGRREPAEGGAAGGGELPGRKLGEDDCSLRRRPCAPCEPTGSPRPPRRGAESGGASLDTLCPEGAEKLRLKDLFPITFTDLPGAGVSLPQPSCFPAAGWSSGMVQSLLRVIAQGWKNHRPVLLVTATTVLYCTTAL